MSPVRALVFVLAAAGAIVGLAVALHYSPGTPASDGVADVSADGAEPQAPPSDIGFRSPVEYDTGGAPFEDGVVDEIIAVLDGLLARPETEEDFAGQAGLHLWRYTTRLTSGYLTAEQEYRVLSQLERYAAAHPDDADIFTNAAFMVQNLMLGKTAPNIVGKDLEGVAFELADSRGKIVAIVFTGEWCGPCRSEYPYQRLLLEVMDAEEFVLLGVNSDADIEVAKQGKVDARLDYRAWWDGHAEEATGGPIASTWNVTGWPTIYVLDEEGVIRRRGPRHEKLITAAKELVADMKRNSAAQ